MRAIRCRHHANAIGRCPRHTTTQDLRRLSAGTKTLRVGGDRSCGRPASGQGLAGGTALAIDLYQKEATSMGPERTRRGRPAGSPAAGLAALAALMLWAGSVSAQPVDPELRLELPPLTEPERPRHTGRALLESAAVLLGGTVWYWSDLDFNSRDWDLRWDWPSWKSKLTFQTVRFDQNIFQTNAVSHPRAGVAQYEILRGNGFGLAGSVVGALASSVFWEYVVEFKEMPSLNDMVVNTSAGLAIGEPFYQLGEFFLRSSPTLFSRGMAGAFSPVASSNDWIDGRRRAREASGALGLNSEIWHRFTLTAGLGTQTFAHDGGRSETGLALASEIVTLPAYGRPVQLGRWIEPGAFTSIVGALSLDDHGITGGSLRTRTSLLGHYTQNFRHSDGDGKIAGRGALTGLGSAFEYESFGRPGGSDYLAIMNVIGPMGEFTARSDGLRLRVGGELYGDFAMVHSLAMDGRLEPMTGNVYRPGQSGGDMPSVLGARGYYYALGLTAGTRITLDYWGWDAGAELRGDTFTSIKGFDRFQDDIEAERDLADRRVIGQAWLGLRPWGNGPRLSTALGWRWRHGLADDIAAEYLDTQIAVALTLVF
jgi:hypothetical protein